MKDKVDALLADDEIGPLAKVQKLRATLLDAGVAYTTTCPCTNFIVHPQNRGTTGVQPYNMHRKGAAILRAGADMSLLTNSLAMEVSSHAAKRAEQMSFNEKLVSSANGLMSPLSGTERFMTLSSSHTCQFIKSLIAGCKTNQKKVGDSTGHLSLHMWRHDSQLQTMAQQGWEWVVLPSYLEDAYPMLAALMQSSLNLANEVFECQSELELACSVAEAATFKIQNSGGCGCCHLQWRPNQIMCQAHWEICQIVFRLGLHLDLRHMKIIQHGTAIYKWGWSLHMLGPCVPAGGEGAPLIHWLSSFTKKFGESLALGQEFMVSVTETHISSVNSFPMVRIGMIATNLTAPPSRVIDGHARLVTKSDIEKLKSKKMSDKINQVEEALEAAWQESSKSQNENFKAFGRMMIRSSLLLLQKEKSGREKAVYTLDEIKSMFKQHLQGQAEAAVEAPSSSFSCSRPEGCQEPVLPCIKNHGACHRKALYSQGFP